MNAQILKEAGYLNRNVAHVELFKSNGTFNAYYQAHDKLKEHGYTIGSMCADSPIGFKDNKECSYISKWYNMDSNDKTLLDGVIISEDFREGDVYIVFFNQPKYIQPKYEQDKTTKTMNKIETAIEEVANGHEIYTRNEVVAILKELSENMFSRKDVENILSVYKDNIIEHIVNNIYIEFDSWDVDVTNFDFVIKQGNVIEAESFDVKFTDTGNSSLKVQDAIYSIEINDSLSEDAINYILKNK